MKRETAKLRILTSIMVLSTLIGGAVKAEPTNKELKIGIGQEFENLNPMIMSMSASQYLGYMVTRSLAYITPEGKWAVQLAKTIPSIENKLAKKEKDGTLTAKWEIIENAKWGDGVAITCDDVKFAWEIGLNENVSLASREAYTDIKLIDVDAKNPKKCTVTYKQAKWDFYKNTPSPMPRHVEEAVFKQYGSKKEGYDTNSLYNKAPETPGLYNGPYMISEIKLGSHVSFVRNPNFYGKKANIEKVIVKLIANTSALEANLASGDIDMISPVGVSFDQAITMDKKAKAENQPIVVNFKPSLIYEHIDMDLDHPALKDINVRHAIIQAIDRQSMVNSLFDGKQTVALHNLAPIDPWFTNDPKKVHIYKYDRKEANKLLDVAGWKMGSDGYRSKDGKRLSLQFMTTAGNKTRETVQTLIQSQLKSVGIEVQIKNEPARVFFGETTSKRRYGALAMYAWTSSPESPSKSTLHTNQIVSAANNYTGQNYTGFSNKRVDELFDKIDLEFSAAKRKTMAQEILKIYTEELPVLPLYYRAEVAVTPKNLTGYVLPGHQFYETNNIEDWNLMSSVKKQ